MTWNIYIDANINRLYTSTLTSIFLNLNQQQAKITGYISLQKGPEESPLSLYTSTFLQKPLLCQLVLSVNFQHHYTHTDLIKPSQSACDSLYYHQ